MTGKPRKPRLDYRGPRTLGPDGYPDDNYIPVYADEGCRLHETCLECPLSVCVEDFTHEGHHWGASPYTRALAHHLAQGGELTPKMKSLLPVSMGGPRPQRRAA